MSEHLQAISIKKLGKRYTINSGQGSYKTVSDGLKSLVRPGKTKKIWALKDISLEISPGEVVGVIGGNGAGKSTLLKVLSGITPPSTGHAELRGSTASLLEVGTGFHPELTGRENIIFYGLLLGMSRSYIKSQFDNIVKFAGTKDFLDTPIKRYSSGMQMRLAFAVAAHLDCDILLIDEVLAVGDAAFQKKSMKKMAGLANSGKTIIFVSHNLNAIQKICSKVIWLDKGKIKKIGPASDIIKSYSSASAEDSSGKVDLRRKSRIGDLGIRAKISSARILNSKKKTTGLIQFGEPFTIQMSFIGKQDIDGVVAGVRIDSDDGRAITGPTSEEQQLSFNIRPKKAGMIEAAFTSLHLAPGEYWITLSLRNGQQGVDQVEQAIRIIISPSRYQDTPAHPGTWGYVQTYPEWKADV